MRMDGQGLASIERMIRAARADRADRRRVPDNAVLDMIADLLDCRAERAREREVFRSQTKELNAAVAERDAYRAEAMAARAVYDLPSVSRDWNDRERERSVVATLKDLRAANEQMEKEAKP